MSNEGRADIRLVELGLAKSRTQAADLIKDGHVLYRGKVLKKASQVISGTELEITKQNIFVGRGAHKLESAYQKFAIDFKDKVVLDVGASTGGFTEFALLKGARHVFSVDVGSDQLDPKLALDSRVSNLEKTDVRTLQSLPLTIDLVVVDISFISLTHIFQALVRLAPQAQMMLLVKPQFEVGPALVGKGGVVKDKSARHRVLRELIEAAALEGIKVSDLSECDVLGKSGNQEYFFWITPGVALSDYSSQIQELS